MVYSRDDSVDGEMEESNRETAGPRKRQNEEKSGGRGGQRNVERSVPKSAEVGDPR